MAAFDPLRTLADKAKVAVRTTMLIAAALSTALSCCAKPASRERLVGSWVFVGDDCQGDAGVTFNADGTWGAYDNGGKWSLESDTLTTIISERGSPDEPSQAVVPPEERRYTILSLSKERLVERWSDGTVHTYVRCP
jgi:hypothetical protein